MAVARLVAELGRVKGRKRLQKFVHLLGVAGHADFQYRFALHFYGPFARELADDLDYLVEAKLVEQAPPEKDDGPYRYAVPGGDHRARVEKFYKEIVSDVDGAPAWADQATSLADEETPFLEALSTVVFLAAHGREGPKLNAAFERAKPRLAEKYDAVFNRATELGLVSGFSRTCGEATR